MLGTAGCAAAANPSATISPDLHLASGFRAEVVANVSGARELAALPNGDLLAGTSGSAIVLVPGAENAGNAGAPTTVATLPDANAAGITLGSDHNVYVGTEHALWRLKYASGASRVAQVERIASVRTGAVAPNTDGDNHSTTSVAAAGATLYASIGSDCNACAEIDPQRASVQAMPLGGGRLARKAKNYRNAIALAVDSTGAVWAGGAGQDTLPYGHPYETFDPVTRHPGLVDYGWPGCYDDRKRSPGAPPDACAGVTLPALVFPAYATLVGAAFYPAAAVGPYAFPAAYRSGLFVTFHGSWHTGPDGASAVAPQAVFVPFARGGPRQGVDWSDPTRQWTAFLSNFGTRSDNRIGRPTGVAVGARGSLFIADDQTGTIYRIRPANAR